MMLSDTSIAKAVADQYIKITPYNSDQLQPASYDFRLGNEFWVPERSSTTGVYPWDRQNKLHRHLTLGTSMQRHYTLHPGDFILGTTVEHVQIPDDLSCQVSGKSSLGRLGLLVHVTAGFVDPGFRGQVTLELANLGSLPIVLEPKMLVGQFTFIRLDTPATSPYNGRYQDQIGATVSRYHQNYE
jgi:dCTP deaminase